MGEDLMQRLTESVAQAIAESVARSHHADPDGHGACVCGEPPMSREQWVEHIQTETKRRMGQDG